MSDNVEKSNYVSGLIEQTKKTKHPYLACITGMWANTYGIPHTKNPFNDSNLIGWWSCGWQGSEQAGHISEQILAAQAKKDKKRFIDLFKKKKK